MFLSFFIWHQSSGAYLDKEGSKGNREAQELYFLITLVWVFRACLADFLEPWPLEPIAWAAILQAGAASALAVMMVVLSIRFIKICKKRKVKSMGLKINCQPTKVDRRTE